MRKKTLTDLHEEATKLTDELAAEVQALDEAEDDPTDEQLAALDAKKATIEALRKQIEIKESLADTTQWLKSPAPSRTAANAGDPLSDATVDDVPAYLTAPVPYKAQARQPLKSFKGENAERKAYTLGHLWLSQLPNEVYAGADHSRLWCREHGVSLAAHVTNVNSTGGVFVPEELIADVIRLVESFGVARRDCENVPMSTDTVRWPIRKSGLTATFVSEETDRSTAESNIVWSDAELVVKELVAYTRHSVRLAEMAVVSIGDKIAEEIALAFAEKEDDCLFNGTGASTYGGIQGILSKRLAGSVHTALTGNTAFSTLDLADFEAVVGKAPDYVGAQYAWYVSKPGWAASMQRLLDAAGGNSMADLQMGAGPSFLGYPVRWSQKLNKTLTAQTDTDLIVFGDLRLGVLFGARETLTISVSPWENWTKRQITTMGYEQFDINFHSPGTATAAGPIIVLRTPSS